MQIIASVAENQKSPPPFSCFPSALLHKSAAYNTQQQKMVLGSHYRLEFKKIFKMQTKLIEKLRKVVNEDMEKSLLEGCEVYKKWLLK